jgi:hypothetical protein
MAQDPKWVELYNYIHDKIMMYDNTIKLPKFIILRLQGLKNGTYIGNKKQKKMAEYDYDTILITFKICRPQILNMLEKNKTTYKDEQHKFNAIMCIIDKEINNVVLKLKNAKKSEEKIIEMNLENQTHESANYISRSKDIKKNIKEELEELW